MVSKRCGNANSPGDYVAVRLMVVVVVMVFIADGGDCGGDCGGHHWVVNSGEFWFLCC